MHHVSKFSLVLSFGILFGTSGGILAGLFIFSLIQLSVAFQEIRKDFHDATTWREFLTIKW